MVCIVVGKWCGDPCTPLFLHPAINTQEQQSDYHSPIIHAVKHMGCATLLRRVLQLYSVSPSKKVARESSDYTHYSEVLKAVNCTFSE